MTTTNTQDLIVALDKFSPDGLWRRVLTAFLPTGVADRRQLSAVAACSRDRLEALLQHFRDLGGESIIVPAPMPIATPGQRGRPAAVYLLGETGAALLRALGHAGAHACGLREESGIAHARAVLDVRLAAVNAGLVVSTETPLPYGDGQVLRPDNAITLPGGVRALFEVEQIADLTLLRRIVTSLQHKAVFYRSTAGRKVSGTVRVLINLPLGREWDRTVSVWERATAIVAEERGGSLPFRILALPLSQFLAQPDWAEPPDDPRWQNLFDPAQVSTFGRQPAGERTGAQTGSEARERVRAQEAKRRGPASQLPSALARYSSADERRILLSYWLHFTEHAAELTAGPRADPGFFELMGIIYSASHDDCTTPWQRAQHPHASLYLLRKYLEMHTQLRDALTQAIVRASGSMRWSTPTITQRMLSVAAVFLRYHGLAAGGSLHVHIVAPWNESSAGDFGFSVSLRPEVLMGDASGVVPTREQAQSAAEALAWVLYALFAHAVDVGLKVAPFW